MYRVWRKFGVLFEDSKVRESLETWTLKTKCCYRWSQRNCVWGCEQFRRDFSGWLLWNFCEMSDVIKLLLCDWVCFWQQILFTDILLCNNFHWLETCALKSAEYLHTLFPHPQDPFILDMINLMLSLHEGMYESGGIVPVIRNVSTRWWVCSQLHPPTALVTGRKPRAPIKLTL